VLPISGRGFLLVLPLLILVSCNSDEAGSPGEKARTEQQPEKLELVVKNAEPELIKFCPASYQRNEIPAGLKGTVIVKVLVNQKGLVDDVKLEQGLHPRVDKDVMMAARRCRFLPGRKDGELVDSWATLSYPYQSK